MALRCVTIESCRLSFDNLLHINLFTGQHPMMNGNEVAVLEVLAASSKG